MKLFRTFLSLAFVVAPAIGMASPCPGSNEIVDPPEFTWTYNAATQSNQEPYYSGTLEIGEASFTIGSDTITTRACRQEGGQYSIPGPTIRMAPGNKYVLRFKNTLPYEVRSPDENVFKDPNISNVHVVKL